MAAARRGYRACQPLGLLIVTPCLGYLVAATAPARIPTLFLGVIPVPHIVGTDPVWYAVLRQVHLGLALACCC